MDLKKYNTKRNFKETPEPKGKKEKGSKELVFVVQQHDASHLHYDFRLELDGVLKSWAVPKGPSMDPEEKRLAMMVEDHPYSYKDFEGTIPEGNYGAGNVIVWDHGTYTEISTEDATEAEKKLKAGIKKGHISFILKGKKLKGEFSLIRIKGDQGNTWLLVKKNDRYASKEDILRKDRSVISKKKLVMRERKKSKATVLKKKVRTGHPPISAADFKPMLAEIREGPFDDPEWIFEMKYDGYRALALVDEEVELFSRNNLSFNTLFAPICTELKKIRHQAVLDGEVVVEDKNGRSDFQLLQNYQRTGKGILKYYVFDLLYLDGKDVRSLELTSRKKLLKLLLDRYSFHNIHYSEHVEQKGISFFRLAGKKKTEGIIAKKADSSYHSGRRSRSWLKIKISQQDEATIAGITEPKGSRQRFGSLVLGALKNRKLKYIGNCGTGFTEKTLHELYGLLKPLFITDSPFSEKIPVRGKIQWIKPRLVCQVKFSEWTNDGHMRHPVYMGLRIDKTSAQVILPDAVTKKKRKVKEKTSKKGDLDKRIGKVTLHLTNQDKIYFPDDKITKGDLVNYYQDVAALMLPYLKDRPQSLNRHPNGIKGPSFFQKDMDTDKIPGWLRTEKIFSGSTNEYIDYLICNDAATLVYMANLGCIEINPWNSRIGSIEMPDWVVLDLDPEAIAFKEVVKAALEIRKLMAELETECYCKTSGASGLHVYIPLGRKYDYDVTRTFAELIAQTVFSRMPETTSIIRSPAKRQKKVYLDFLQNRRGQTLAAPYSVRPRPGATVSTPLEWKEVNQKLDPGMFTIRNTLKRLDKLGDIWKPVIGKGADLRRILKKLNA